MSRLNETSEGWQWDDSPVFPQRDAAIAYGQSIIRKEIKKELKHLKDQEWHLELALELLEKEAEKGPKGLDKQTFTR